MVHGTVGVASSRMEDTGRPAGRAGGACPVVRRRRRSPARSVARPARSVAGPCTIGQMSATSVDTALRPLQHRPGMGDHVGATRSTVEDPALDPSRAPGRTEAPSGGVPGRGAAPGGLPVAALLGLHRAAGNAAVVQMLRAGGMPAAPVPPAPAPADRDEEAGAPIVAEPSPQDLLGAVTVLEEGERPTREMKAAKRAESESVTATDEDVQTGGGGFPVATPRRSDGSSTRAEPAPCSLATRPTRGSTTMAMTGGRTRSSPAGRPARARGVAAEVPARTATRIRAVRTSSSRSTSRAGAGSSTTPTPGSRKGRASSRSTAATSPAARATRGTAGTSPTRPRPPSRRTSRSTSASRVRCMPTTSSRCSIGSSPPTTTARARSTSRPRPSRSSSAMSAGAARSSPSTRTTRRGTARAEPWTRRTSTRRTSRARSGPGKVSGKDYTNRLKMPGEDAPPE